LPRTAFKIFSPQTVRFYLTRILRGSANARRIFYFDGKIAWKCAIFYLTANLRRIILTAILRGSAIILFDGGQRGRTLTAGCVEGQAGNLQTFVCGKGMWANDRRTGSPAVLRPVLAPDED